MGRFGWDKLKNVPELAYVCQHSGIGSLTEETLLLHELNDLCRFLSHTSSHLILPTLLCGGQSR